MSAAFRIDLSGQTVPIRFTTLGLVSSADVIASNAMLRPNNLSDVASPATARTNLGATAAGSALFTAADASAQRTALALVPGTNVLAYDADIQAIAGLTSASDKMPYATGAGTWAMATLTSFARTLLDDTTAAEARTTLGADLAANVSFTPAGTGAVVRTAQDKLRDLVSVKDFGAVGDDSTDDTAAINLALAAAAGAKGVFFPAGIYRTTGLTIPTTSVVRRIVGDGAEIKLIAAASRIALTINKQQFLTIEGVNFTSTGSKTDGFATQAIKWAVGASYQTVRSGRIVGYSGDAVNPVQCVNLHFADVDFSSCGRGYHFAPNAGLPCAAVRIDRGYISGCDDGIYWLNGLTAYTITGTIIEYCGDSTGATNAAGIRGTGGQGIIHGLYFEANYRNYALTDTLAIRSGFYELAATYANVTAWSGVAFGERGYAQLTNRVLTLAEILPDATVNADGVLVSGNLGVNVAPIAGVQFYASGSEARLRLAATNSGGQAFELISGGGGLLGTGNFGVYDNTAGAIRFEIGTGTGKLAITGSTTSMEVALNGSRLLKTRRTGWTAATGTATRTTFDTATVTLPQLAERVKALLDDQIDHGLIGT